MTYPIWGAFFSGMGGHPARATGQKGGTLGKIAQAKATGDAARTRSPKGAVRDPTAEGKPPARSQGSPRARPVFPISRFSLWLPGSGRILTPLFVSSYAQPVRAGVCTTSRAEPKTRISRT